MKIKLLTMIALLSLPFFLKAQKNDLLPQELIVRTYTFFEPEMAEKWNLFSEKKDLQSPALLQKIMNEVIEGNVISKDPSDFSLYNNQSDELTTLEVKERLGAGLTQ